MSRKFTRRTLLGASLGAAQLALLERFMSFGERARADEGDGPTRLLVVYLPGGVRFYPLFCPLTPEEIDRTIPPPTNASQEPIFFRPDDLVELDGDSGGFTPLRMGRNWNPADPGDRTGYRTSPMGYSWVHYGLGPTTAVLHGIDNGSFAHDAAYVGAMCGIAGGDYRAPAVVSTVANHLHARFAGTRPIPCVAINGSAVPRAPGLPAHAQPTIVPGPDALANLFSSDGERVGRWSGCDHRERIDLPTWDGSGTHAGIGVTTVDGLLLERTRALGARANGKSNDVLGQIYESYAAVSRTLASDVVTAVEAVTPVTIPKPDHLRAYGMFDMTFGLANGRIDMTANCEWILRLLKSNITSVVYANMPEHYYDYHNGSSVPYATAASRAQLDILARLMGEMMATPSPDRPGRTLYDDTVVVIQSEFNRTWMTGRTQDDPSSWGYGDDHNAVTSVVVSGGTVAGNRQIGGFDLENASLPYGLPVDIEEEDLGHISSRPPRAADTAATLYDLFGMRPGADYFIPGGYGVIQGLRG